MSADLNWFGKQVFLFVMLSSAFIRYFLHQFPDMNSTQSSISRPVGIYKPKSPNATLCKHLWNQFHRRKDWDLPTFHPPISTKVWVPYEKAYVTTTHSLLVFSFTTSSSCGTQHLGNLRGFFSTTKRGGVDFS